MQVLQRGKLFFCHNENMLEIHAILQRQRCNEKYNRENGYFIGCLRNVYVVSFISLINCDGVILYFFLNEAVKYDWFKKPTIVAISAME